MQGLNYHHLLYFWLAAKKGGVTAAARQLNLAQPTISGQIRQLETALGAQLFTRAGRGLQLTEMGRTVYSYADEIFTLGEELVDALHGELARPQRVVIGVSHGIPRLIVSHLIGGRILEDDSRFVLRSLDQESLGRELKVHGVDAAIMEAPPDARENGRAYAHLLGQSPIAFYATPEVASRYGGTILDQVAAMPLALPSEDHATRASLDGWLENHAVSPRVVAEVDDPDLLPMLARTGQAGFFAPEAVADDLASIFGTVKLGTLEGVTAKYWAVAVDRRFRHGTLHALSSAAKAYLKSSHPISDDADDGAAAAQ